jgi:hypothetical protein
VLSKIRPNRYLTTVPAEGVTSARRVYDYLGKVDDGIDWKGDRVTFEPIDSGLQVAFRDAGLSLLIPTTAVDYIITIDAIPVSLGTENGEAIAVLATGRATGARDLLAIISDAHELVYLELLERRWDFRAIPLAFARTSASGMILVGTNPDRLLAFAFAMMPPNKSLERSRDR